MKSTKKVSIFLTAFLCVSYFMYAHIAYAAQQIANMPASVGVNPIFSVGISPLSIDFGLVDPGTTTIEKEITLSCSTNNNSAWSLLLSDTAELTSGTFTIPNNNFKWRGSAAGSGTWYAGTGALSITPFTFYGCGLDEYITSSPVGVSLYFSVNVPATQPAGSYTTTLVITMTE